MNDRPDASMRRNASAGELFIPAGGPSNRAAFLLLNFRVWALLVSPEWLVGYVAG